MDTPNPRKFFVELLRALFTSEELRRFIDLELDGEQVVREIDFSEEPAEVAYAAAQALGRMGFIDEELFARLREVRPRQVERIDAVAREMLDAAAVDPAATHVLTLEAAISGLVSVIDDGQVRAALGACAPKSRLRLDLHDLPPLADGASWSQRQAALRTELQAYLREQVLPSGECHVSVFGLAPIPWLMALGHGLSETVQARIFQRFREPSGWSWQPDDPGLERFSSRQISAAVESRDVALLVSASAPVQMDRVDAVLPPDGRATYEIALPHPRVDAVRSEAQLASFGRTYRALLDQIEQEQRCMERLHVFAASPVAVAIECGRRILHSSDPPVVAYQYAGRRYVRALELRA